MLVPLFGRIKVRPDIKETKLTSGIILPDARKEERNETGIVVAVGDACTELEYGDHVLYGKYAGFSRLELPDGTETESKTEGTVYQYMNEEDVVGIFR